MKNSIYCFAIFIFYLGSMKNTQLKWFSFIEILMIITILALISVVAYTSFWVRQNKAVNTKIQSEVVSLSNALLLAKQENNELPQPQWNRNFFAEDTSYVHNYEDDETFWVHGFITHNTLAKKYIDIVPVDPRTGSFYAYWKTKGTEMYEVAWVIWEADTPSAFVNWDYDAENGPFNLIREYNGPNFVHDQSSLHFPYNPNERVLTATIDSYTWSLTINGNNSLLEDDVLNYVLKSWDTIEIKQNGIVELYYSDGSRSILWDTSRASVLTLQEMEYPQENNLVTDIKLVLESWMIWNKAASLDDESWFEIYTTDSTAAVRWTVFGVQKNENNSEIVVQKWKVAVNKNLVSSPETIKEFIRNDDVVSIPTITMTTIPGVIEYDNWETVINVDDTENEKWAAIWTSTTSSTWSVDDIPDDVEDIIITNTPIINNNIKISLKDYTYSSINNEISISLNIPKRVYKWADFLLINWEQLLFKKWWGWWTNSTSSGDYITHTFDNTSGEIINTDFTENDIVNESGRNKWVINSVNTDSSLQLPNPSTWAGWAGSVEWINVSEQEWINTEAMENYFSPNDDTWEYEWRWYKTEDLNENTFNLISTSYANVTWLTFTSYILWEIQESNNDFTLQIWKFTHNWKVRLTNEIKFTIIDEKSYLNEEEEGNDDIIDEDDIEKEKEEQLVKDRWIESSCDGFEFTNINGDDKCADADDNLVSEWWNLTAYAPLNNFTHNPNTNNTVDREKTYGFHTSTWNINVHSLTNTISTTWSACKPKYNTDSFYNNACEWDYVTLTSNWINFNPYSHLTSKDWEIWIFVDNYANDSKLKYDLDSTYKDLKKFVVEFNVRWWALKRTSGNYFLLNNVSDDIKLYLSNWNLLLKIDGNNAGFINSSTISTIVSSNIDEYFKIFIINENGTFKLKLANEITPGYVDNSINLWRYQYIWLRRDGTKYQWNGIINYIKIYK